MLEAFQRAYAAKAFPVDKPCPVSLSVIEHYLQILIPAFKCNLVWQSTSSTIADVVPSLMVIISKWQRMEVTGTYKLLCNLLVSAFKQKFQFELNSPIYNVASILLVSNLKNWFKRADCAEFRKKGFENIASGFLEKKKSNNLIILIDLPVPLQD